MSNTSNSDLEVVPAQRMDGMLCFWLGRNIDPHGKCIMLPFTGI